MTNQDLIKKADLAVSDLTSDGGLLNPEQTDAFIRKLLVQPTILASCRTVRMNSPQRKINKIGFGSRILKPAVSHTPLSSGDRSKPTTEQVTLSTKEVIAEVQLPYDVIEDNIERGGIEENVAAGPDGGTQFGGGLKDTLMSLIAERVAVDLEELAIQGDTLSGDAYLALVDGFLKLATAHTVDQGNATVDRAMFKAGLQAMPDQYLRNLAALRHYLATDKVIDYRDSLAARETILGDSQIQNVNGVNGFGVPVEMVSLMPGAKGLFTNPQNLIFGVQRRINMEVDKDIRSRAYIIVVTARVDFAIEETDAVVKYINVG